MSLQSEIDAAATLTASGPSSRRVAGHPVGAVGGSRRRWLLPSPCEGRIHLLFLAEDAEEMTTSDANEEKGRRVGVGGPLARGGWARAWVVDQDVSRWP